MTQLTKEQLELIMSIIKNFGEACLPQDKITPAMKLADDLDFDQLDEIEVMMELEDKFGIQIPDQDFNTVQDFIDAVAQNL